MCIPKILIAVASIFFVVCYLSFYSCKIFFYIYKQILSINNLIYMYMVIYIIIMI